VGGWRTGGWVGAVSVYSGVLEVEVQEVLMVRASEWGLKMEYNTRSTAQGTTMKQYM
jgi:hypothetical protein